MVLLWEACCTVFSNDRPTILAELLNFLLCRRRHFTQAEKREAVASILYHKMDESTMIRNPASHFWSCRAVSREFPDDQPENKSDGAGMVIWDLEESSAGPRGFVPRSEGSVIFFANHTLAIEPGTKVAEVVLLRVGNLSDEVGADLATVDGTAFAGSSYKASRQRVVFAPNSSSATFSIELLDCPLCVSHRFFVAHVEAVHGNATMGSSSFTRIRLLPEGVWPPGARPEDVLEDTRSQDSKLKNVPPANGSSISPTGIWNTVGGGARWTLFFFSAPSVLVFSFVLLLSVHQAGSFPKLFCNHCLGLSRANGSEEG